MRSAVLLALMASGWAATVGAAPSTEATERAVLACINEARAHPERLAAALRRYRERFDGRVVHAEGSAVGVVTAEGVDAVDEAIASLERQPPLPPLAEGPVLASAARGWAATQGPSGEIGHASRASAGPGARALATGGNVFVGEVIFYGMDTPEAVVRQLVIDDGVPGRGHRSLLFSTAFRHAGVGCGPHARYRSMCVIDLAATPDGAPVLPQVATAQPSRASAFSR